MATTVDIEKAFLMISIKLSDRNFLCFLWIKDIGKPQSELTHLCFNYLFSLWVTTIPSYFGSCT